MELSKLQQKIVDAPDSKVVVMSAAASGKTATMTEKVRHLLHAGIDPHLMVVITFTNMAAEEMRQRLGDDYQPGLYVGTIHGLANYFLLSAGIKTGKLIEDSKFDELFKLVKANPYCIKPIEYLILDEAQDSDQLQFEFIFDMIRPTHFYLFGDVRQSIYQWHGSNPELLLDLCKRPDVTVFNMNENYRNGYNILQFAKHLIQYNGVPDNSIARREENGSVHQILYDESRIIELVKSTQYYKDWAILVRTNRQLSDIEDLLDDEGIPHDTFKQGDLTKAELTEKMNANTVKILTVHSAKGLEWNNVIAIGMFYKTQEERNVCYVAATRARDQLIWMTGPRKSKSKVSRW